MSDFLEEKIYYRGNIYPIDAPIYQDVTPGHLILIYLMLYQIASTYQFVLPNQVIYKILNRFAPIYMVGATYSLVYVAQFGC